jgi:hypothetical protein
MCGLGSDKPAYVNQAWHDRAISFNAQNAWANAQALYPQITGRVSAQQQRELERVWADAARDSAHSSLISQGIEETSRASQREWADIMTAARNARGNLEVQQSLAAGQAQLGVQLQQIEGQLATMAREQSQRNMSEASRALITQQGLEEAAGTVTLSPPAGRVLPLAQ